MTSPATGRSATIICCLVYNPQKQTIHHISFYERYGWEFLCMVQDDGEPDMTRMYIHK